MRIYWYAPFDNASEIELAELLSSHHGVDLTVHSCSHRFGSLLTTTHPGKYELVRNLPPPAGEMGEPRSKFRQIRVIIQRAVLRHKIVRGGQFDIVHLHTFNPYTDWIALRLLRRHVPVLVQSIHDVRPHARRLPQILQDRLLKWGYRSPSILVVAHSYLRELLNRDFSVPLSKIVVVPLPVGKFVPSISKKNRQPGEILNLLFLGTLRENKGIPFLLEAMKTLRGEDKIRLKIAGRGSEELHNLVSRAASDDDRISTELGYISDERIRELLCESDVLVLPYTEFESQSGVLSKDAYGALRPVIASDIGALGTKVRLDRTGLLVKPKDALDLANGILLLLKDADLYSNFVSSIVVAAKNSSVEVIVQTFVEIYKQQTRS